MASKKEILTEVVTILEENGVDVDVTELVAKVLRPKTGGARVDLSEVTRTDDEGNVTEIMCSVSGVWLPATEEYFYAEKQGTGIAGLKRVSKQGESVKKAFTKTLRASEKGIMADFTSGDLDPEEAKRMLADLTATAPDYSSVGIIEDTEEA